MNISLKFSPLRLYTNFLFLKNSNNITAIPFTQTFKLDYTKKENNYKSLLQILSVIAIFTIVIFNETFGSPVFVNDDNEKEESSDAYVSTATSRFTDWLTFTNDYLTMLKFCRLLLNTNTIMRFTTPRHTTSKVNGNTVTAIS